MTYAPQSLLTLRDYLKAQTGLSAVALGIVGDAAHKTRASYHNGRDAIEANGRTPATDYTIRTARDLAGLTNAASAIDIGNFPRLRELSVWLVERCRANDPDARWIREWIYSPDGIEVLRWDRERGVASAPRSGEADNSHRTHSHAGGYRDTEQADRTAIFRRFFEGTDDVTITRNRWERWKAANGNGVLRRNPVRSEAPFVRLADGTEVSSFAEVRTTDGNNWREVEYSGPAYLLRADFDPVTPGGDPALDAAFALFVKTGLVPEIDPQDIADARAEGYADGAAEGTKSGYRAGASKVGERVRAETLAAAATDVDRIVAEETA